VLVGLVVEVGISGELGVEALDGGDGDLADGIDAAGAEHLDVVEVGELAAVVGGGELLEFVDGLAAEVAAVDEEEDALRPGVLDEAVGLGDGGEGLAGTGGHLDECARAVGGEGFFKAGDGVDLALAERGGVQRGELAKAGAEGVGLLDEFKQVLGSVEGKDRPRAGVGVALVAEVGFDAGRLVGEGQGIGPALRDPFHRGGVAGRLLGDGGESGAFFLGFDDAEGLAVDEEDVVGRSAVGLHFPDGDAARGGEIERGDVLDCPARGA
jgi:hypothetical protein